MSSRSPDSIAFTISHISTRPILSQTALSTMRYQHVLLPALASLVFASDDVSVAENPAPTPDALPFKDLREIPVPTFIMATGLSQEIPYATSAAIAEVSSQVAATPLSVFPAATDVPINEAGTAGTDADAEGNSNVIVNSGSKLKRSPSGAARQPRVKRGNCSPQPTITNVYNVKLGSAAEFRADPAIASVASNANAAPTGYYQNFKNLGGANSAMNYLSYTVVNTGYDVDYCAAKCTSKSGCLSFNIYFERDPTVDPGNDCPDPEAFANIKCSFWGTGLDTSTANNVSQWRNKF